MTVLDKKLRRDLFLSKGMLAAIISIIVVGAGCLVGLLGTFYNLHKAQIDYYSRCRMADFWMSLKKAPLSAIEDLKRIKGISDLRSRITFPVVVDLEGINMPLSGKVLTLPSTPQPVVNNVIIRSGGYFTDKRRNEVIISEKFAQARNIAPGSFIHLILNGQRKKLFVVGTGINSEFIYMTPPGAITPDPAGYGIFWLKREYAEDIYGFHGACNDVVGHFTPEANKNPELVIDEMSRLLAPYGIFSKTTLKNQSSNLSLCSEMQGLKVESTFLPAIFLGVAAMVLNVVMMRMAEQQRTIIGTLKALGVRNSEIFMHYLKFGLIVGVIGGVGGCAFGYWISSQMTTWYKAFFTFPKLVNHVYPGTMIMAFLISVVFAAAGVFKGVKKVIRLNPAEAMHPPPPVTCGKIFLEKWETLWKMFDFRWQMVLRGLFRNFGRTTVGIIAAAFGSAIVLLALGMSDSFNYMLFFQFQKVLLGDYTINVRDDVDHGALYEARKLPGITHAEPQLSVACNFYHNNHFKKGYITGITHNARLTIPRNSDGSAVKVPPTGLLMTKRLAKILKVRKGDTIRFVPIKGLRKPCNTKVVDTVDSMFGLSVYADYNYLNHLIDEENAISSLHLTANQNRDQQNKFMRQVKKYPKLSFLSIISQQRQQMKEVFINKMKGMIFVMIIFAGIIFFGSILNSALISIAERQREIATFRVLGYQSLEVGEIFLRETMVVSMIGAVIGLPLGYYMLYGLALMFTNDMFAMPCVVDTVTWFYALGLAFIFVLGAYFIIQNTINKMDWGEALKMKE